MASNNTSPDEMYRRTREDLLPYEDARFNSLLQSVANYYTTRNDQSTWGNFLRALAQQLGQMDFDYSYDIVGKDPNFLTPADIRRRWADPLYVSSAWPTKTQFDTDFKLMLIELIKAYREGSTVKGIQDVIFAYTGINIQVQELYKEIGNGVFDQSDRNAIKVSVSVGNNSLSQITSLTQLQQIVNSLYGAIDLAKPAHVGLEFTTIFGEGDDIDCFISPTFLTQQQFVTLTDSQKTLYSLTGYVLISPPVFWVKNTEYEINTLLRDSNGNLQFAIAVTGNFLSGSTEPTWNPSPTVASGLTTDNEITWLNISPAVTNLELSGGSLLTVVAANNFTLGQQVSLTGLDAGEGFGFLNPTSPPAIVKLSVLTSDGTSFTAAYTHTDVASTPQTQGTVSYIPAAKINILAYQSLSQTLKFLYQERYTNTNCASSGIDDTLRIYIRQVEEPPQDPMLIQAPVLDPKNPTTTVAAWGRKLPATLTPTQYAALPSITFNIVNTVADGANAGYTFSTLSRADGLHEGTRVTITGCTNDLVGSPPDSIFNMTGKIRNVQYINSLKTSGTFEIHLAQIVAAQAETGSGNISPLLRDAYKLQAGQYILLEDSSLPPLNNSNLTPPNRWIEIIDRNTNMPTGEVANWDKTHPAGLVAPRLNACWEIKSDQDFVFGMS